MIIYFRANKNEAYTTFENAQAAGKKVMRSKLNTVSPFYMPAAKHFDVILLEAENKTQRFELPCSELSKRRVHTVAAVASIDTAKLAYRI